MRGAVDGLRQDARAIRAEGRLGDGASAPPQDEQAGLLAPGLELMAERVGWGEALGFLKEQERSQGILTKALTRAQDQLS